MQISAVIITKNSERTLQKCLESLPAVVDEIIIVDSGSTDSTLDIAKDYQCKIINTPWLGYGPTKNLGQKAALAPYVLSIDSDEELSAGLQQEILSMKNNLTGIYGFRRINNYCGKWIKYGSWYPDKKLRLFPKENLWNNAISHEQLMLNNQKKRYYFKSPLLHYAYSTKEELKVKTYLYAQLGAANKKGSSKILAFINMLVSPVMSFLKSYFMKLGFLDGKNGFEISTFNALGTYLKYKAILKA